MQVPHALRAALAIACLVAGCSAYVPPVVAPDEVAMLLGSTERTPDYKSIALLFRSALSQQPGSRLPGMVPFQALHASSERGPKFDTRRVMDGNPGTAWGPSAEDAAPELVFELEACTRLSGLGLKMSAGSTLDVAIALGDRRWRTVASGLSPVAAAMDWLPVSPVEATQVKLIFHNPAGLLVCEVELYGRPCDDEAARPALAPAPTDPPQTPAPTPSPSPRPRATATPTPEPTAIPTPTPTPTPSPGPEATPSPVATPAPTEPPADASATPAPSKKPKKR